VLPDLLIALWLAFGLATVLLVILNEQNSPRLARVQSWPGWVRTVLALALCGAVGFTISLPLGLLGLTGVWAMVAALPIMLGYLFWRDIRDWWKSRSN
jgi:FtsH-binding integral membrane protein